MPTTTLPPPVTRAIPHCAARRPRVLLIAEACNPEWESVPLVGYNWYRALREIADVTLVTQIRNRLALLRHETRTGHMAFIDSERLARPFYLLGQAVTLGRGLGWTTRQALMWLPYLYFERLVCRRFRDALADGGYDIVHRLTPLSPTYPSPLASWIDTPFVLGPLNGGLPWPPGTARTRWAEAELLSYARGLYRRLPYVQATYRRAACVLAGSRHTLGQFPPGTRSVYLPENGIDPARFGATDRVPPGQIDPFRVLFVGRLVPYKGPDVVLEAFAAATKLPAAADARTAAELVFVGDGPLRGQLEARARELGVAARVRFTGWLQQAEVAEQFRRASVFAFPSLREFGGAVVMEALACGLPPIILDYGGPGEFVTPETGIALPVGPRAALVDSLRAALEACHADRPRLDRMSTAGLARVAAEYTWPQKAARMASLYESLLTARTAILTPSPSLLTASTAF